MDPETAKLVRSSILAALGAEACNFAEHAGDGASLTIGNPSVSDDGTQISMRVVVTVPFKREGDLTDQLVRDGDAKPGETILVNPHGFGFHEAEIVKAGRKNYSVQTPNGKTVDVPFSEAKAIEMLEV